MRILKITICTLITGLFLALMPYVFTWMLADEMPYTSSVANGDLITFVANEDIQVSIYATDATEPTVLMKASGEVIGTTQEGAMPGYYDLIVTVKPGEYQIEGNSATLTINSGFMSNPAEVDRYKSKNRNLSVMGFYAGLLGGFAIGLSIYGPQPKSSTPE